MNTNNTLSEAFVKFIDYGTEEYFKQLVLAVTSKKLVSMVPFSGCLIYPSDQFSNGAGAYYKSTQFQDSFFIGKMEMLLPDVNTADNSKCAYTLLTFVLDGVTRQIVQIANPSMDNGLGVTFSEFILRTYPKANKAIPFSREGFHTLTDIEISGGQYVVGNGSGIGTGFNLVSQGAGSYTPSIQFEMFISGYKCIVQ